MRHGVLLLTVFMIVALTAGCGDPYQEGMRLIDEGQYLKAAAYFNEQTKKHPDDARAYHQLGFCYTRLKNYKEAGLMYNKALELNPDYFEAAFNLGTVQLLKNEWDTAELHLKHAIALKPDCEDCYVNLAWVYYHMRRFDLAMDSINKAVALSGGERGHQDVIDEIEHQRAEFEEGKKTREEQQEAGKKPGEADSEGGMEDAAPQPGQTAEAPPVKNEPGD